MVRALLSGNEAVAEGALAAGCNFFAGYPITPSSEIMHYMARELPKRGGSFIQAEDELAAINMVIGASWAGARAMTATSGPGFSLMQEGLGYAIMTETPLVIVNVMRAGPATGQATKAAQGDLMQARWGRHGDQMIPVLAPSSPQEAYDLTIEAFAIAEELRTPVVVLSDEFIAHGREVVELREKVEIPSRRKPRDPSEPPFGSPDPRIAPPMPPLGEGYYVIVTGSTHNEYGYRDVHSFETHFRLVKRLVDKIRLNVDKLFRYEVLGDDDAEVAIVCFGSVSRSAKQALRMLRSRGVRAKLLRLVTLWPMNDEVVRRELRSAKTIVVPEMNLGQLIYDVQRLAREDSRIVAVNKVGGGIPIYPSEIVEAALGGSR
ncbi:MAG: 2-oxoacid:acceptor oxidoreductase subunit alpha [Crenarchaeota archaeon]|nr:2-oxoacid:acceptor oxidoreductase subunit alpha [Thermoproteota archaeon]